MNVKWTEWEKMVIGEVMNVWQSGRREWVREGDRWRGWSAKWWMSDGVGEKGEWVRMIGEEGEWSAKWAMWWQSGRRGWVRGALKHEREGVRLGLCDRDGEWESEAFEALILKYTYLKPSLWDSVSRFETESQRLGFHVFNHVTDRWKRGSHVKIKS